MQRNAGEGIHYTDIVSRGSRLRRRRRRMVTFGSFISNKLRNYLPRIKNQVQHAISNIIFTADHGHFEVSYAVSAPSPASYVSSPTTPFSVAGSVDVNLSNFMCI